MSEILIENITKETEVAFNFQGVSKSDGFAPVPHEFGGVSSFPELLELSRHSIHHKEHSFEGISFKNTNLKPYVTVTMTESQAGFKNIFGKYVVDDNGYMRSASILASNTRKISDGDNVSFQHSDTKDDLQFFLVANGYSYNKHIDKSEGAIEFIHGYGTDQERLAKVTDDPETIDLIYKTAEQEVKLTGPTYHTSNSQLNHDGKLHSIAGLAEEGDKNSLRVGFEDFPNLGDADFNDLVFDVEISYIPSDSILAHGLNDMNTASGTEHDELTKLDLNLFDERSPFDGSMIPRVFEDLGNEGLGNESLSVNDDSLTEESLNTLLSLDNIIQERNAEDLAIAGFVGDTKTVDNVVLANDTQPVGGAPTADLEFDDNTVFYSDFV